MIDGWKNRGLTPTRVPDGEAFGFANGKGRDLYALYQRRLKELNAADFLGEGFADRAYAEDGTLVPRSEPGAVLTESEAQAEQAVRLATGDRVRTLCLHGDTPGAAQQARAIRRALEAAGVEVTAHDA